jgi:pyruvate/2-oxoglutarate dehydrogenase complex dihydrolipoamide dehydrogenase (E3) component
VGLDPSGWENSKGERILVQAEEVDRNLLSDNEQGFYELAVDSRGKILGARGTAQHLETWLALVTQAMQQGIPLGNLADAIHPYPGLAEALTKAAGKWRKEKFAKGRLRGFLGAWLGRN